MKRIFIDKIEGDTVTLTGDTHTHLSIVLRARRGDKIELCSGDGFVYAAAITAFNANSTTLIVTDKRQDTSEPSVNITLFFALQKGDHNDLTVQKCVELGVNKLIPITTKFTVASSAKIERLNKIALEAAKQCGRNKVPIVENVTTFDAALKEISDKSQFDLCVFPYEKADKPDIKTFLKENLTAKTAEVKRIAVLIGAEGGFSEGEAAAARECGITPVTLGARILRADTACMAVLACIVYESGNLT